MAVTIRANAELLAQAVIRQAYKDYRNAAIAVNNDYRHHRTRGQKLDKHKDRLRIIQKELLGDRIKLCTDMIFTDISAQEMKDRFESENNEIFYPLWEKKLLLRTKELKKP
jgi:hypothetical protein